MPAHGTTEEPPSMFTTFSDYEDKDRSLVQGVPLGVDNYFPVQLPSATPTMPEMPHYSDSVSSMPAHDTREEPPSMFSASMAPRDRGAPEVNPSAEAIAVVPTKAEIVSDMETTTTFIDSDSSLDKGKDSSLEQGVRHGVDNSFPAQRPSVPTTPEMPNYSDSFFSIQLPRQPTAGSRHPPLDTPHGADSDAEGSSSGDMDTPESVIPTSPVFTTDLQGDPDKPKIVYKEDETTANMTEGSLDLAESTLLTPDLSKVNLHSQQIDAKKGDDFPLGIKVFIYNITQRNQSGRSDGSSENFIYAKKKVNIEANFTRARQYTSIQCIDFLNQFCLSFRI